jgi:hypothetical protein
VARRTTQAGDGVVVAAVKPGTAAARAGLRPGDRIVAINQAPLRDVIDFHFHAGEERLRLSVEREGRSHRAVLTRRGPGLGLELEAPRPAEIATCANKCVFCFIHQLPKGMRKSLYVKDDDFRLSFLHGNYVTLTDLEESELQRIETQRLSPLYVSVHATDPDLRHALLGEPRVRRELLPVMERLAKAGIAMHAQIVLCPGWNDGAQLDRTVHELARLHPAVPHPAPRAAARPARGHRGRGTGARERHRGLAARLPGLARHPLRVGSRRAVSSVGPAAAHGGRLRGLLGGRGRHRAGAPLRGQLRPRARPVARPAAGPTASDGGHR